jgi:hypothetical protein
MKFDADRLPREARALAGQKRRRKSKPAPYQDSIVNAVEGTSHNALRPILKRQCRPEVSKNNLRGRIHQVEFRKSAQPGTPPRVMLSE